jgi:hypothetical protein
MNGNYIAKDDEGAKDNDKDMRPCDSLQLSFVNEEHLFILIASSQLDMTHVLE